MKHIITTAALLLLAAGAFAAKAKLTVKNTAGADLDEVGDYDLVTHARERDINDDTQSETAVAFGDRLQADYESALISARARLELLYTNADDAAATLLLVPSGYVHVTPVPQFGVVAGNNFYKRFAAPSAYLAAADDTTKYGRLLTDSLGAEHYFGNDSVSVFSNGVAGGVTSDWQFGSGYLHLAGGATVYPDGADTEKAVDFGVNAGAANGFDLAFTAHDVTEDSRKFGVFAGLTAVQNLVLNAQFYYNFTSSDYLPEERVERSGADEFKKQTTKYALGLSGGYRFAGARLGIYADIISGLTNEYIGKIKYYDNAGNLIDTKTTTIVRGATTVKYKYTKKGVLKAKRTDEFTHEGIPFYSQLRLTYDVSDNVTAACNVKLRTLLNASDTAWLTFYPRLAVALPSDAGTVGAGVRLDMNAARYSGISSVSVPLTYTYKFKKKFK